MSVSISEYLATIKDNAPEDISIVNARKGTLQASVPLGGEIDGQERLFVKIYIDDAQSIVMSAALGEYDNLAEKLREHGSNISARGLLAQVDLMSRDVLLIARYSLAEFSLNTFYDDLRAFTADYQDIYLSVHQN